MRNKHRIYEENRPYFITVVLDNRRRLFGDERWVRLMADIVAYYKGAMEFKLYEYVFMPDHYHVIISATPNRTFSDVIKRINGCFSRRHNSLTGNRGRVFRKEFYDIGIRDDSDYIRMAEYIHNNPVRSGFVDRPEDYSWSSAGHRLCGRCSLMGVDDWR